MPEEKITDRSQQRKNQQRRPSGSFLKGLIFLAIGTLAVYFVLSKPDAAKSLFTVLVGFGAVIMVHELGHFTVAKLGGVKVEAFSIGYPPTFIALGKNESGLYLMVFPKRPEQQPGSESGQGSDDTASQSAQPGQKTSSGRFKAWETEYRIGLIPFGGFVKMLGQEDVGSVEKSSNPRSFANKPVWLRMAVVAAGVTFNAISAVLLFMILFMIGKDLPAPVVGDVVEKSPAQAAGIRPKDRIVELEGERFLDFTNIIVASALAGKGQPLDMTVEHEDGGREKIQVIPEKPDNPLITMRAIGVEQAQTTRIEPAIKKPDDIRFFLEKTKLLPGDVVAEINNILVKDAWHLKGLVEQAMEPTVRLTVRRTSPQTNKAELVYIELPLMVEAGNTNFGNQFDLASFYGIVPRLKIEGMTEKKSPEIWLKRVSRWFKYKVLGAKPEVGPQKPSLQAGDIIVEIGQVKNPTFKQLREVIGSHVQKDLPIKVLRQDKTSGVQIIDIVEKPTIDPGAKRATIGFLLQLDTEHPVVAAALDIPNGPAALDIPSGAAIETLAGQKVNDFYDIARILRSSRGQRVNLEYRLEDNTTGSTALTIPAESDYINAKTAFAVPVPFEMLREHFHTKNPVQAFVWGCKKSYMYAAQSYLTIRRLFTRDVSPQALSGPVGIISISYKMASEGLSQLVYFFALVSPILVVMNLLPLPIVDGGAIVLLIIEKIKGSPISPKIQEIISYVGLVLIAGLFLWLTYNDLLRMLFT